jgi:uncharacterized membrane protein
MATRKKRAAKQPTKVKLSPTELIIKEIVESAQVVVVAIACIGVVCIMAYAISMVIIDVFAGSEIGKIGGAAVSAVVGISVTYAVIINKNVRKYLGVKKALQGYRKKQ